MMDFVKFLINFSLKGFCKVSYQLFLKGGWVGYEIQNENIIVGQKGTHTLFVPSPLVTRTGPKSQPLLLWCLGMPSTTLLEIYVNFLPLKICKMMSTHL